MQSRVESFNGKSDEKYIELSKNVIKMSQFLKKNNLPTILTCAYT